MTPAHRRVEPSPLPDSNRRPLPYHGGATTPEPRQTRPAEPTTAGRDVAAEGAASVSGYAPRTHEKRYRVGCSGQFVLAAEGSGALHHVTDDEDEAIAACATGPLGCGVFDTVTGKWIGPTCWAEIEDAKRRIMERPR